MSRLQELSQECMKSELDIFTVPMTQTSVEKSTYVEIQPVSAITGNAPLEFYLPGAGDEYYDLNNSLLFLRVKITLPDGRPIGDGAKVGLINYPIATLFSQVDVTLGDRLISQSSSTYPYRAILECLLNYDKDVLKSNFSAGLFIKDISGDMDDTNAKDGENDALNNRALYTNEGRVAELIGPIHADLFFQEKLMLNGIDIKLRFVRSKDEFSLMRDDNVAYKININYASVFVKKVTVSPPVRLAHAQTLLNATARYPLDRVIVKTISIPADSRISTQENLFLGTLPKSIVVAFVDNDAFMGVYNKNPFNFKHYNLEFLAVYLDGQQFPSKPFQPNFGAGLIARDYYQLVLATNRHLKNRGLAITREDFLTGYTLYAFNLSPDDDCSGHLSLAKTGTLRLEARFAQPLPRTVTLIVYAVFDSVLEISNRRQVLMDC